MDIFADRALDVLTGLACPILMLLFVGAIGIAMYESLGRAEAARSKRFSIALAIVFGTYLLLLIGSAILFKYSANQFFESLRARKLQRLVVEHGGGRTEISDPKAINDLLERIAEARVVGAHHSHSENEVILRFPEIGYAYSLGRDSENEHEYWLHWIDDHGGAKKPGERVVRQFHSEDLGRWLRERLK